MANEKIISTRIINKHVTWEQATTGEWKPYEGEIVLAKVDTKQSGDDGVVRYVPTYLMKVGAKDAEGNFKKIKDLKWLHAPASDVYTWAKQQKLAITDTTSGNVITNIEATDDGITITRDNVATSDALDTANQKIQALQEALAAETGAREETDEKVAGIEESLAEGGTIHELIDAAQTQADKGVTDAAAAQKTIDDYKLANDAVIANLATKEELSAAQEALEAADEQLGKDIVTAKEEAIAAAGTREETAAAIATAKDEAVLAAGNLDTQLKNELQGKIDAVDGKVDAVDAAYKAADDVLDGRIGAIEEVIDGVAGAMHFVGAFASDPDSGADGDVYVNTSNNKEYVYSGGKWVELGDVTEEANRIKAIEDDYLKATDKKEITDSISAMDAAYKAADLEINNKIGTSADPQTASTVYGAIAKALADAKKYADDNDTDTIYDDTALSDRVTAVEGKLDGVTKVTDSINAAEAAAVDAANGHTDEAIETLTTDVIAPISQDVATIKGDYLTSSDKSELSTATDVVAENLGKLAETVEVNKADVDSNFAKFVPSGEDSNKGELQVGGVTIIFDCGGVEQA